MRRRDLLRSSAAALAGGLAGCTGPNQSDPSTSTRTETSTDPTSTRQTTTETATTTQQTPTTSERFPEGEWFDMHESGFAEPRPADFRNQVYQRTSDYPLPGVDSIEEYLQKVESELGNIRDQTNLSDNKSIMGAVGVVNDRNGYGLGHSGAQVIGTVQYLDKVQDREFDSFYVFPVSTGDGGGLVALYDKETEEMTLADSPVREPRNEGDYEIVIEDLYTAEEQGIFEENQDQGPDSFVDAVSMDPRQMQEAGVSDREVKSAAGSFVFDLNDPIRIADRPQIGSGSLVADLILSSRPLLYTLSDLYEDSDGGRGVSSEDLDSISEFGRFFDNQSYMGTAEEFDVRGRGTVLEPSLEVRREY